MLVRLAIDCTDHGRGLAHAYELAFQERLIAIEHGFVERFEVHFVTTESGMIGRPFKKVPPRRIKLPRGGMVKVERKRTE